MSAVVLIDPKRSASRGDQGPLQPILLIAVSIYCLLRGLLDFRALKSSAYRGRREVSKRFRRAGVSALASMYPVFDWSCSLRITMDISARAISLSDRPQWASWVTSVRMRREDRSSIFSHPLADLGGEKGLDDLLTWPFHPPRALNACRTAPAGFPLSKQPPIASTH